MDFDLMKGPKTALVTGAGARLGQAMAIALGQAGWRVAVHYRSSKTGALETVDAIKAAGSIAYTVQADLSDPQSCGGLIDKAADALGEPVTLLINSASTFVDDTALTHTQDNWDFHFGPNLRAPIVLSQALAAALPPHLVGLIINMIDMRVLKLNPLFFTYTLSKSALWTATRTMAQSFAPNIRVNGIGPGPTLENVHQKPGEFEAESAATLTQNGSNPAEIVKAMQYLIDAQSITGQMIASDGGQHLMWQTPDVML